MGDAGVTTCERKRFFSFVPPISSCGCSSYTLTAKPALVSPLSVCCTFGIGQPARAFCAIGLRPQCSTSSSASTPYAS